MLTAAWKLGLFSTFAVEREMLAASRLRNLNANWYVVLDVAVGAGRAPIRAAQIYPTTAVAIT
jgi:hypothetical protein